MITISTRRSATRTTITPRRGAPRAPTTDIRWSSTGSAGRGARRRTLSRIARGRASALGLRGWLRALRGGALGWRRRGRGCCRRRRRRRGFGRVRHLAGQLRGRLPELAHCLADPCSELRQPAWPEDDQNDDEDGDDPDGMYGHQPDYSPPFVSGRSGLFQVTRIVIEMILSLGVTA